MSHDGSWRGSCASRRRDRCRRWLWRLVGPFWPQDVEPENGVRERSSSKAHLPLADLQSVNPNLDHRSVVRMRNVDARMILPGGPIVRPDVQAFDFKWCPLRTLTMEAPSGPSERFIDAPPILLFSRDHRSFAQ